MSRIGAIEKVIENGPVSARQLDNWHDDVIQRGGPPKTIGWTPVDFVKLTGQGVRDAFVHASELKRRIFVAVGLVERQELCVEVGDGMKG
jgi:hypothetical protein